MRHVGAVCCGYSSHDHSRDGVLEDELLLPVCLQHNGVLIKGTNAARQLDPAEQINRDAGALFAGCVEEGILNVLRRLIAIHSRSPRCVDCERLLTCRKLVPEQAQSNSVFPEAFPHATGTRGDKFWPGGAA